MLLCALVAGAPTAASPQCPGPTLTSDRPPPAARPWTDRSLPPERRAALLLGEMALEEEIDLATGEWCEIYGFYDAPIDRLGIPALAMTDGPAGVRIPHRRVNGGRATQLPAPVALAASWDPGLAAAQGDVLGAEALATGTNVLLGPTVDLARSPLAGRTFEGLGEDPLLASRMAVPLVKGIQAHPVLAGAKHFAAYGQETDRFTLDARVGERALRELYLRPFAAAVSDGGVATVMCGFNRVNGSYACEDRTLLAGVLKGDLGFGGFVMSDFGGTHSTMGAATAGLDQELASGRFFGRALLDAVQRGDVPRSVVDDKARRILEAMFRFGLFDTPAAGAPLDERTNGARSRELAEQGVVLLRNEGGLLPLAAGGLRSIAVIGADAANVSTQGGGAARVEPTYGVSALDAIRSRAGPGVTVSYAAGSDPVTAAHLLPGPVAVPSSVLAPPGAAAGARGLRAEYWLNTAFDGAPEVTRVEAQPATSLGFFDYQSVNASSVPQIDQAFALSRISARWSGTLTPPVSGDYAFTVTSRGHGRFFLGGALLIDDPVAHELDSRRATVHLEAGAPLELRLDYVADAASIGVATDRGGDVKLGWEPPAGTLVPAVREAADLARASDVAVVVVRDYGTEERDRLDLALPGGQDALVAAVAAANPRTVVVLMTGQGVAMPWLDAVPAVVEAWYAGQEQGNVVARLLFGDVNPSGKLPVTFPASLDETPIGTAGAQPAGDGEGPVVSFSEDLLVGYRWYDAKAVAPLFPFGHGLSYTTFGYEGLLVTPAAGDAPPSVSFTVRNTGPRAGAEVSEVYVGACPGDASGPPRRLAGFAKTPLDPGASQRVTVALGPEALTSWSPEAHAFVPVPCTPEVAVGASSRDLRLRGSLAGGGGTAAGASAGSGGPASGGCGQGGGGGGAAALLAAALLLARRGAGRWRQRR